MLTCFMKKLEKKGMMISAVDLLKGIAVGAKMGVAHVEGANGGLHTNYAGKTQAAVDALCEEGYDFAYIHVEAPDEMGHQGSVERKVTAIEYLDERVIGPLVEALEARKTEYRLWFCQITQHQSLFVPIPQSRCPICCLTVPTLWSQNGIYNEKNAKASGRLIENGYEIMRVFI